MAHVFVQVPGDTWTRTRTPSAGDTLWDARSVHTLKVAGSLEKVSHPSGHSRGVWAPGGLLPGVDRQSQGWWSASAGAACSGALPSSLFQPKTLALVIGSSKMTHSCCFLLVRIGYHWKTNDSGNHFIRCILPKLVFQLGSVGKTWTIFFSISTESSNLLVKNCSLDHIHIFLSWLTGKIFLSFPPRGEFSS